MISSSSSLVQKNPNEFRNRNASLLSSLPVQPIESLSSSLHSATSFSPSPPSIQRQKEQAISIDSECESNLACRICLGSEENFASGAFISPCDCQGTMKFVHTNCLVQWVKTTPEQLSGVSQFCAVLLLTLDLWGIYLAGFRLRCELCGAKYKLKNIQRRASWRLFLILISALVIMTMMVLFFARIQYILSVYSGSSIQHGYYFELGLSKRPWFGWISPLKRNVDREKQAFREFISGFNH